MIVGAILLSEVFPMFHGFVTSLMEIISPIFSCPIIKTKVGDLAYKISEKLFAKTGELGMSLVEAFKSKLTAFWNNPLTYVKIALTLVGLGIGIASGKIELSYANRVVNQIKDVFYRLYVVPELRPKVTELILSHPKMPKDIKKAVMKLSKAYPRAG